MERIQDFAHLPPLPQSRSPTPSLISDAPTTASSPATEQCAPDEAIVVQEIPFYRGKAILSYYPSDRMAFFRQRFTFVCVLDGGLRKDLETITRFDDKPWQIKEGSDIYRLADLAYLLHRMCGESDPPRDQHVKDCKALFEVLEDELDRMNMPQAQIHLSLCYDLEKGANEWLQYFYWCHIVRYLQPDKVVVLRVDNGHLSTFGEAKAGKIHGAQQSGGGLILTVGWDWGTDRVKIPDSENLNNHGILFSDPRMEGSALLRGWAASRVPVMVTRRTADIIRRCQ